MSRFAITSPNASKFSTLLAQRKNPDAALAILPYYAVVSLVIIGLMHLVITFDSLNTLLYQAMGCGFVAFLMLSYIATFGKGLDRLRFGGLTAHAFTYALIVGGNLAHVFFHALTTLRPEDVSYFLAQWAPITVAMGGFWGLGLIVHALAVIFSRGYEANGFLGGRPHA